jgi:DNA-binding MarR family transcriptional regulator
VNALTGRRAELAALIRQYQRDADDFDQAVAERAGINRTDLRCLDLLLELAMAGRGMTPGRLVEASGLTPSTITSVLDRLERAGYVRRVRDQENRRQVILQLTAEFAALTQEIFGPVAEEAVGQLEQLSDNEVEVLLRFFADGHDQRVKRAALIREQTARQAALDTARGGGGTETT